MGEGSGRPLLRVEGISKRFGATRALEDVSVEFRAGEVHALMGENGAGKSTLGKTIAGLHRQDAGTVTVDGAVVPPGSVHAAFAAGVRIVHQELAQCPSLSVAENLSLHEVPTRAGAVARGAMVRRARALLERIEPGIDPRSPLGDLSPGHRQIVQIAGALDERVIGGGEGAGGRTSRPRVIVFDEPTSSLSLAETERLLGIVRRLASEGLSVIYVSHRMSEIFACCDRATVLRDGRHIATTAISDLDEPALIEQMIGRRLEAQARREPSASSAGAPALEVRGMDSPGKLEDVSLSVAAGEILGVGGLVGAGRSELLDAVFGLDRRAIGEVLVRGRPVRRRSPRSSIAAGMGYVPEDRRLQGLFFELGVGENIVLPRAASLGRAGLRSGGGERGLARDRVQRFQIKAASLGVSPGTLSGGNQQKVLIARWMAQDVKVLLLDEPTRGIDVGTKAEIYRLIRAAADKGMAILLVSSEMPELLSLSDRVMVLAGGRVRGELEGARMMQADVLRLATRA